MEKVKVEIGVKKRKYLGTIFGYEIFLEPYILEMLEKEYPDEEERKKAIGQMFDEMIPVAEARYDAENKEKKK